MEAPNTVCTTTAPLSVSHQRFFFLRVLDHGRVFSRTHRPGVRVDVGDVLLQHRRLR